MLSKFIKFDFWFYFCNFFLINFSKLWYNIEENNMNKRSQVYSIDIYWISKVQIVKNIKRGTG